MTPAEATLQSREVFTAFKKAGSEVLRITAADEEPLLVLRDIPASDSETLTPEQLKVIESDFDDFQKGNYIPAREAIAKLRARHAV